jgi:flavocytochrome c
MKETKTIIRTDEPHNGSHVSLEMVNTIRKIFNTKPNKFSNIETATNIMTTRTIDVAIIGSGFAGLAAAIEAASNLPADAQVVIFEKMPTPGGNSIYNAGQIAAVGSKYQQAAGIQNDSVRLMMDDMLQAGIHLNHPELLETMIYKSNEIVEWTELDLNIRYRDRVTQLGGHSVPRTLSTLNASGKDIIQPMLEKIQLMHNVHIEVNSPFQGYVFGGDAGAGECQVLGVRIGSMYAPGEAPTTVFCRHGVILAAGGFSADVQFRSIQNPSFGKGVMSTNQPGATAEVLKETMKAGAMPVQLSHIQLGPWTSPDESGFGEAPFFCIGAGFPYGIIVNPKSGKRFVNELGNRYERSMSILALGYPVVCLTDADGAQHSLKKELATLEPAVKSYPTLTDLAQAYDIDANNLIQTVQDYNEGVKVGKDSAFGKPFREDLGPIVNPPFFATRLWPKVHFCCGGVQINQNAQVMHIDGYPISGLFAAGEVTGGIHGGDRLGSCSTLDCLCFGRIAGHSAATCKFKSC